MFSDDFGQSFSNFCTRKWCSSYRTEGDNLLHILGTERYQEVAQAENRKRYLRKDVRYDAAFQFRKAETLEDEHGRNRGKNDAVYHE